MPIISNEPPDPPFDELCNLTKVTSAEDLCTASFNDTKVKVMKVKHRKPLRGGKVSTPGSAGAGSVLRRLRSAKSSGKARDRNEDSPGDNRGGKRMVSTLMDDEINKVLSNVRSGMLNNNLKFYLGCLDSDILVCAINNVFDINELSNDGSFINSPLDNSSLNDLGSPVAKSCGLQTSSDHTGMRDVSNTVCGHNSSTAKTCNVNDRDMAGSGTLNEHTSMEDVVNTGGVCSSSQDGISSYKVGRGFMFGKQENSKGILNPPVGPFFNASFSNIASGNPFKKPIASNGSTWNMDGDKSFGSSMLSNQFSADVDRFAEKLKQEVYKGGQACSLQLYGYFVGTSMDYRVVRGNLMRMWRIYDIEDITKANSGVYYFKFKSEEGMKRVLESGPWMIQNVPLVLNVWEPGIWLEKTESIPIWVCVYNIPMELCNGSGIGKIMSGVGKPLLMDKMTRERCVKKAGKMDFARVLVEVYAEDNLPNGLEIEYPPLGNKPVRVGKLEVKYQWRPPLCSFCKTFGHSTLSCKVRPRTDEEIAAKTLKDVLNVGKSNVMDKGKSITDDDGFTVRRVGGYVKRHQYQQKSNSNAGNVKSGENFNNTSKSYVQKKKKKSIVDKPILASVFNHNYRPKVLVRGSGSNNVTKRPLNEDITVKNHFNILSNKGENVKDLGDINVNEEFESKVWPDLKEEVDILLEAGIYPSKQVRLDWSIHQMDYFYKNYHKFHLDPCCEDDEGGVDSNDEGIAVDMKPEVDVNAVDNMEINAAFNNHIFDGKKNLSRICNRVLGRCDWVSNSSSCDNGTRIIVGWDLNNVNIMVLNQSAQVMHCFVEPVNGNPGFLCSFIYACVRTVDRRSLWKSLSIHKNFVKDKPWTILGDFNACLDPAERSTGGSKFTTAMHDFRNCVEEIEVEDIAMTGLNFTWNKKPRKDDGLLKKLDGVLGNSHFMSMFPLSYALFLLYMLSDHTPVVLVMPKISNAKPKPFKFQNYLTAKDDFIPVVRNVWNSEIDGFSMFSLVSKLKLLKKPLRKLNFEQALREEELRVLKAYRAALKDEELFLRQKAKVEWLRAGDNNSSYFHNVVKGRRNRNRISYIENMDGVYFCGNNVGDQFVNHFKNVLGQSSEVLPFSKPNSLFMKKLPAAEALKLVRIVSNEEIKLALFDIDGNKASGPDEINATVTSLVPKVDAPSKVSDYRPIACCNVFYKIISKVICNRLKGVLGFLVDENQSAFIPSRQISDNIMLSQELMRNYHRNRGPAKCAFKIDIEKAYDFMEWVFLSSSLKHFGFPELMVKWIMNCITSTSFTVNANGDHTGFFKGKQGLRQGDPLSPYLFTLVMEVFNIVLRREIDKNRAFRYHWQCKEIKLTHLCFADDLLLFCNGDSCSVVVLKKPISTFGGLSGLLPNFAKSTVFFGNVREVSRLRILDIMPFRVGSLPVRYLGVPLISKRLYVKDCHLLIDKARKRLLDWKNKSLSFTGRLQLIMSVLSSMQVYWASVFILSSAIANDIERFMRDFLWNYGVFKRGKACVNWNSKESLWVRWINTYRLKGRNFWDVTDNGGACWAWKKLLRYRRVFRSHIFHRIGDGKNTSLWFDNWHAICPLSDFISKRKIFASDLSLGCKVADVIRNGSWEWPSSISNSFDVLSVIPPPVLVHDKFDVVRWKSRNGNLCDFSVSTVWDDIRRYGALVPWAKLVWFSQCIPRHSFMLWLAFLDRLKTHDNMHHWDKYENLLCVLCGKVLDCRNHLFFECKFPNAVWCRLNVMVKLDHAPCRWNDILKYLLNRPLNKSIWSILQRLVFGACIYIIWQERNLRCFQNRSRNLEEVCKLIIDLVRLRVLSLSLTPSAQTSFAAIQSSCHISLDNFNNYPETINLKRIDESERYIDHLASTIDTTRGTSRPSWSREVKLELWIEMRRRDIGLVIVGFMVECCDEAVNVVDGSCDLSKSSHLNRATDLLTLTHE
uniref:Reverse transcriptase domain-containing protein n=1 Tax=Tanacetum cinerariifolium TaxID=118510 RepID=A0A6L2N9D7_TANCI|nr:hypothetical protein [Tanacetum cinerariifolium]